MSQKINYSLDQFDEIKERILERQKEQQEETQKHMNVLNVLENPDNVEAKHELTEEQIAAAEEFREEQKKIRSGRVRGMKKFDLISGTVFKNKVEDFVPDQVTIAECKTVRKEMSQVFHAASNYTNELIGAFAPDLAKAENKEIRETFIGACGSITPYEIANLDLTQAKLIIDPVKHTFITAELMAQVDQLSDADLELGLENETAKFFVTFSQDIISKIKATVITKTGVDSVIATLTKYLENLIMALGYDMEGNKTNEVKTEDEIYRLKFKVNACRNFMLGLLKAESVEFSDQELKDELEFIDSIFETLNLVDTMEKVNQYIARMKKKIKIDLKKGRDAENTIEKFAAAMINSTRRYPIPGVAQTAKEVRAVLFEYITSTMLSYDFGTFFADYNLDDMYDEEGNVIAAQVEAMFNAYDVTKGLNITDDILVGDKIPVMESAKTLVHKLYVVNTEKENMTFTSFLAKIFPNRYRYFKERTTALVYLVARVYARNGRFDSETEYEAILIMEVLSKLIYGENARRVANIYRTLDEYKI